MEHSGQSEVKRNKRGSIAIIGGIFGDGGDTGMHPKKLFYCGEFWEECRCGKCDGFCGPANGCPCNSCVELVNLKVNKLQHLCRKGTVENGSVIGQENINASDLYYCGRIKNQCYCGGCDGMCGPHNGCPCFDCLELVDIKVNQLGHFCRKGPINQVAFHLNRRPLSELYYCRKVKTKFGCGICTGICDPAASGCPCDDCYKLSETRINRVGDVCYRGNSILNAGHTRIHCTELLYCNKLKKQCHCGTCDGNCGPSDGCPCFDCLELVGLMVLPTRFTIRVCKRNASVNAWQECPCDICRNYEQQIRNSRGHIAVKGNPNGPGGYTNVESKNLYYCGVVHNECGCGRCDGRCGPTNGCPCSSCSAIYFNEISLSRDKSDASNDSLPCKSDKRSADLSKESCCVVCLDSQKTILLVPCGHYAFCKVCADVIVECAICRAGIQSKVTVYES